MSFRSTVRSRGCIHIYSTIGIKRKITNASALRKGLKKARKSKIYNKVKDKKNLL